MSSTSADKTMSSTQASVLQWLLEVRAAMRNGPCAELLTIDGVDVIDVLLSPLYLATLGTLRGGAPKPVTAGQKFLNVAREWGYRGKTTLQQALAAWHSAPVTQADIVLWTRDITHTAILVPVAEALAGRGASRRVLSCQAKIFEEVHRRDPDAVFTLRAWPRVIRRARAQGHRRAKGLAAIGNWSLPPMNHPRGGNLEPTIRAAILQNLPQVCETLANARSLLEQFRPKVLVVGNDITFEGRGACRVAAAQGVPTAVFMHGSLTGDPLQSQHCADRVLVFGNIHRQELVDQGLPHEQIVVCGAPSLDKRPVQTGKVHARLAARLDLHDGEPWILVATSGPGNRISHAHHEHVIASLMRLSAALPEVPIVIKLHRKDKLEYYWEGLKDCPSNKIRVVPHDAYGFPREIFEWLQGCSMVLTGASTVALEAMLMDVPVITMDFRNEVYDVDFIKAGATVHVQSTEELESAVRRLLPPNRMPVDLRRNVQSHLEDAYYALDGRSSLRGAESLCELARLATN